MLVVVQFKTQTPLRIICFAYTYKETVHKSKEARITNIQNTPKILFKWNVAVALLSRYPDILFRFLTQQY